MEEFAKQCKDQLVIVYFRRGHPHFDAREKLYRDENNLGEPIRREYPDYVNGKWKNKQWDVRIVLTIRLSLTHIFLARVVQDGRGSSFLLTFQRREMPRPCIPLPQPCWKVS